MYSDLEYSNLITLLRSRRPDVFCEKGVLKNSAKFTGKHLFQSLFFNKVAGGACNFIKKESLAQVFLCEFCEISKNTFFYRTALVAAFGSYVIFVMFIQYFQVLEFFYPLFIFQRQLLNFLKDFSLE